MNSSPPAKRKVLTWEPSPRRRVLGRFGLGFCTAIGVARIISQPWLWLYLDQRYVDLIFVLLLVSTAGLIAIDLHIGFPRGYCQHWGYDLTGNVSGICPECGRPA